ncbi:MAG: tRNA pseudouridine(55) synthase TruB, partial [Phycisphaeraceae bacterium]
GVLICCLGKATKAVDQLMGLTKIYQATVDLSAFTVTDDVEGEREEIAVDHPPTEQAVRETLAELTGTIEQTPPIYSAMKVEGRRAYALARQGEDVKLKPRPVRIDAIDLQSYHFPRLKIVITCGKGTYIRSLARQIGHKLGTGGHLADLCRLAVGPYTLEQAVTLEDLPEPLNPEHLLPVPSAQ